MRDIAKIRRDIGSVQAELGHAGKPVPRRRRALLVRRSRLLEELALAQEEQRCGDTRTK